MKHLETRGRLNSRAVFTRTTSPVGRNRPSQFQFSPTNCLPEGSGYKKCRISSSHPETRFHTPTCAVLQWLISLPMPPQPNNCHGELGKSQTFIEEGGYFDALRRSLDSEEPGAGVGVRKVLVSAERVYQCSHSADSALPSAEQALLTRLTRSSGGNGTTTSQGVHPGRDVAGIPVRAGTGQRGRESGPVSQEPSTQSGFRETPFWLPTSNTPGRGCWVPLYVLQHCLSYSSTRTSPREPEPGGAATARATHGYQSTRQVTGGTGRGCRCLS